MSSVARRCSVDLLELVGAHLDGRLQVLDPPEHVLLVFVLELRRLLALRVELAVEAFGLALDLADRFDLVLDLLDQAALDELGELHFADELRQPHLRAHHGPAGLAVLALLAGGGSLGGFVELLFELLHDGALLADRVDLLQHFLGAFVHPLVGDLIVLEDHELADGAAARLELIAHGDDVLAPRSACGRST